MAAVSPIKQAGGEWEGKDRLCMEFLLCLPRKHEFVVMMGKMICARQRTVGGNISLTLC